MENKNSEQKQSKKQEIRLKVMEAVQDDVNRGIVKIDSNFMKQINISPGDIVEIVGERKTAAIAERAYPGDIGLNIVRMDGNCRSNARTSVGEIVIIRKAEVEVAKKVFIAPTSNRIVLKASPHLFKVGLMGKALTKGDLVSLGNSNSKAKYNPSSPRNVNDIFTAMEQRFSGMGFGDLKFMVVNTDPKNKTVIVGRETEVEVSSRAVEIKEDILLSVNYEDIGGLSEEIKKVREMIELPLRHPEIFDKLGIEAPKGVLLYGPPGTGKTLLAKAVASESAVHFMELKASDVISGIPGATEKKMGEIFEEAQKNAPTILFMDELDSIAFKRQDRGTNEFLNTPVSELLKNLDGLSSRGKVVVIAATNRPNSLDPALRRPGRFDREIEIGVPDKNGRLEILKIHTRNMPLAKDINLKEIANVTHGFVGADLHALAKEAAMIVLRKILPDLRIEGIEEGQEIPEEILSKLMVYQKDFQDSLKVVRPSAMREVMVEVPELGWKDIGGLTEIKQRLQEAVEWPLKHRQMFKHVGIRPPKGILLYGPPGTGKTMLAKAVAKESEANFIQVNGPSLQQDGIVGKETEQLRKVFKRARQTAPSIIFFDEIDSFAKRRGTGGSAMSDSNENMLNQLLIEMDGIEILNDVVVIAATNRPDILDTALLRPGRFDNIILTTIPDKEARIELFKIYTKEMPITKNVDIKELADRTEGYVGADIESLCREAGMFALRQNKKTKEVSMENFQDALKVVHASVDKEIEETYEKLSEYFSKARSKAIGGNEGRGYFG
ncbi:CDC48 family AAA ATPase [archaeon]|jgi:transitional endoplasmic reticulum ATPase|nr:CDC48 family AAA ATPase [archaeon]MBT3451391.1 CDC48 family AAA ATPase [archaeon]MBT6869562.1 CDC48 family AAA ATPase [archaeon]MBT7193446.1 CDC48 family AAA ATPase [archaeon]MBT7381037.1 CDC48 family AAA ATPase [archaeon]